MFCLNQCMRVPHMTHHAHIETVVRIVGKDWSYIGVLSQRKKSSLIINIPLTMEMIHRPDLELVYHSRCEHFHNHHIELCSVWKMSVTHISYHNVDYVLVPVSNDILDSYFCNKRIVFNSDDLLCACTGCHKCENGRTGT